METTKMQTANNGSEVVGVDVEDPADDDADGDVSFTTPTTESPSRVISNDDNANPGNINTTKWRFISFVAFLVAAVIIIVAISVGIAFDGGEGSTTTTVANNDSTTNMKIVPGKSSSLEPDYLEGGWGHSFPHLTLFVHLCYIRSQHA